MEDTNLLKFKRKMTPIFKQREGKLSKPQLEMSLAQLYSSLFFLFYKKDSGPSFRPPNGIFRICLTIPLIVFHEKGAFQTPPPPFPLFS